MIKSILVRIGLALAAASILATSAAIFVVALAFALYAWVQPMVGPVGAAGIVAGAAALLVLLVGLAIALAPRPKARLIPHGKDPAARIVNFLKEKPVTAVVAAIATGFFAIRNPKYLGSAVRSFLEGQTPTKRRR